MAEGHQQSIALLVCQVHDRVCALPLAHVLETMRYQPLASIPGSPPHVSGLSRIRGEAIPVLDLARLLGMPSLQGGYFIAIQKPAQSAVSGKPALALAVQAVQGVRHFAANELHQLPSLLRETDADLVAAISARDTELLMVLDSVKLMSLTGGDGAAQGAGAHHITEEARR